MSKDSITTTYRILTHRHHLLAHLLCLLLIVSTPVLAQTTTDVTHQQSRSVSAVHNEFGFVGHDPCSDEVQYTVTFNPPGTGSTAVDPFSDQIDPDLNLKAFSQGAGTPKDQRNTYDMGVDPATLTPEALDLNIFPTFEISAQLSLIPSLSYSPDHVMSRMSQVQYGAPKQWCNHYGEIVVMVAPTIEQKIPIGDPVNSGDDFSDTNRKPTPSELQIFFINASGQQVNFYPDPTEMGTSNSHHAPNTTNQQVTTWFSEDGTYQLVDKAATSASGPFDFELRTSSGLVISFEPYVFDLDMDREALMRRFRVDQIHDRYANFVDIVYRDEASSYQGAKTLQPWKARGFANGSDTATDDPLSELEYLYDTRDRLIELKLPAYGAAQTQSYKFYYLDSGPVSQLPTPEGTINRLTLNHLHNQTLTSYNQHLILPPLTDVYGKVKNSGAPNGIFLNFESLGFAPEIAVDFQNTQANSLAFKSAPYQFHVVDSQNAFELLRPSGQARQIYNQKAKIATLQDPILYRNRLDADFYNAAGVSASEYPDFIAVSQTNLNASNTATVKVLPRLKDGDVISWLASGNQIKSRTLNVTGSNLIHHQGGTYFVPVHAGGPALPGQDLYLIRQDQRDRIAEIEYPDAGTGSRKRLLFKYEEHSRNHAEIAEIYTFDEPVGPEQTRLLSQTSYTYEQVLVQTAAEDLFEPETESLIRNCNMLNRKLNLPAGYEVESGVHLLRRHELLDILRHKRLRYYEPGLKQGPGVAFDNYRDLETFYGGSWRFALMGHSEVNEADPAADNNTCDSVEWGVAHRPFRFTWQINPDGSAQVFDLSADGVGLDPVLAYANTGSRVFKTYQFDTNFKQSMVSSSFDHFLGDGNRPFTSYYQYMPSYQVDTSANCTDCTIPDLVRHPNWPSDRAIPSLKDLFGLTGTKAYNASIQLFEPIPLYGYSLQTDILPNEPLKKLGLGTLHGAIYGGSQSADRTYFRASALEGLDAYIQANPNSGATIIDKYLRGKFVSNIVPANPPPGKTFPPNTDYNIAWAYGGRLNNSACFREIHQRQKNHRLRPHAQLQLQNLNGFGWDDTRELIDLDMDATTKVSPYLVEASRFSNGGYMGEGIAASAIQSSNAGEAILTGISVPDEVVANDFFYYEKTLYKVTSIDHVTNELECQPSLVSATALNGLKFYRFYDKNQPAAHPYLGYDVFGNNAFKATYKRNQIFFSYPQDKTAGDDHGLVPNFFDNTSLPFTLSLNDSTDQANNDVNTWTFFGRVSRQFETGSLGLNAERKVEQGTGTELATINSWRSGLLVDTVYNYGSGNGYLWLPTDSRSYYLPASFDTTIKIHTLNLTALASLSTTTHAEDVQTTYRYFSPGGISFAFSQAQPMSHGRLAIEWSGKAKEYLAFTQLSATRYTYDSAGWLAEKNSAVFKKQGTVYLGDYGTRLSQTHDPATGLVIEESTRMFGNPVWNSSGSTPEARLVFSGSGALRSKTVNTYDVLGRLILTETFDGNEQAFGNRVSTEYPSQTLTITKTRGLDLLVDPFTTQYALTNGQGQPTANLRKRGGDNDHVYATYTFYDAFGRPASVTSEEELDVMVNPLEKAIGDDSAPKGHTRSIYNLRGEAFGTVLHDGFKALQSNWLLKKQAANGNLTTYQLQQLPKELADGSNTVAHLKIKALSLDENGLLTTVEDFHKDVTGNNALWTTRTEAQLATSMGDLSAATLMAKATYTYDRMGKLVEAKVGKDSQQEQKRTFFFDQRDRLRTETHPEMPDVTITYANFDFFDNPTSIIQKDTNNLALRSWIQVYDTSGHLLSTTATQPGRETITTQYAYHYSQAGAGQAHPYPEIPFTIRHHRNNNEVFLYRHELNGNRGLLIKRSLYHNQGGFPGESSESLTAYDLESATPPTLVSQSLDLTYTYDALGRVMTMAYPTPIQGMALPTKLEFLYGAHGLLETVNDLAFQPKLNLMDELQYGVADQLTYVDYSRPNAGAGKNYLARTYDALNRLQNWQTVWNGGGGTYSQTRDYAYDLAGRIHQIEIDKESASTVFKGYRYAYEGLAQIAQAAFTDPATATTTTWDYGYDNLGFGNLDTLKINGGNDTIGTVSTVTNRIETGATYNQLGELKDYTDENSTAFVLTYNSLGRLAGLRHQNSVELNASYRYDHAGMRVFTEVEGTQASPEAKTLYFYDADGMVLSEWVSEKETTWQLPHWDRSYIYLAGKSSLTYEYDAVPAGQSGASVPAGPAMTHGSVINEPVFQWQSLGPGSHDLEIKDADGHRVGLIKGIKGTQWRHRRLTYGKYQVRVRQTDQAWGSWKTTYYMDQASEEKAGFYPLDWEGTDHSYYQNNLTLQGQIHYADGKEAKGVYLNQGESIELSKPHQYIASNAQGSASFWVKPDVDPSTEVAGADRDLWTIGGFQLIVSPSGQMKVKMPGVVLTHPNANLNGTSWQHIAVVYGNGIVKVYLDDGLTFDLTSIPFGNLMLLDMRWGHSNPSQGIATSVDDIRCFNKALTAAEINAEFTRWN